MKTLVIGPVMSNRNVAEEFANELTRLKNLSDSFKAECDGELTGRVFVCRAAEQYGRYMVMKHSEEEFVISRVSGGCFNSDQIVRGLGVDQVRDMIEREEALLKSFFQNHKQWGQIVKKDKKIKKFAGG